ncbi:MAG: hypothetical protein UV54_C0007G0016 [Candidatus Beckwithbacteria bacterium GW2011_GWA2_43_10]|uniref:Uncharacterized protein n=1 Tax=Candidatus Beckwithbacteria bacterium GW2011_GWA2_43_10 TaxID=1618369 RepID=A0A0G1C4C3_9BACT|nr:MAG: hypothetical protein UV54_C0007G0016 [Candidatus Beckwithbacteria bacterium GW2011_GWA2_43_10]
MCVNVNRLNCLTKNLPQTELLTGRFLNASYARLVYIVDRMYIKGYIINI